MKRQRKGYQSPTKPWDKTRIDTEKIIIKNYGLKSKREIWRAQAMLRKYRRLAREVVGKQDETRQKVLMDKLMKFGMTGKDSTVDTVLGLTVEDFLNRRLQTVLHKKGMCSTPKQARQFITHGNVMIGDRKIKFPSYMVPIDEEDKIVLAKTPLAKVKTGEENGASTAG